MVRSRSLFVCASGQFSIRTQRRVALEDAETQSMGSLRLRAIVTEQSGFESCAERVGMEERPGRSDGLKPVNVLEIAEQDVNGTPPIPFRDHLDRPPII
jgi:hypothetical protein